MGNVPWMIGGDDVLHSANVGRLVSYIGGGGQEGVIGSKDFEVRETAVPGTKVRVFSGACAILNRFPNAKYEAYAGRRSDVVELDIAATGAGAGRTDLIVARIEDPYETGSTFPAPDPALVIAGAVDFLKPAVISGVPAATKTFKELGLAYPAIELARVTLPVSTGTVTQAMITDLRRLTRTLAYDANANLPLTAVQNLTAAGYGNWPSEANFTVDVPDWATHVMFDATLTGINFATSPATGTRNANGGLRVKMGTTVFGDPVAYNLSTDTSADRVMLFAGSPAVAVPAAMRGTSQVIRLEGARSAGNAYLSTDTWSQAKITARFLQQRESNL